MGSKKKKKFIVPYRIPLDYKGIQVNYCRNTLCENFGHIPSQNVSRGAKSKSDGYRIIGGWDRRVLYCKSCGRSITLKSNEAIWEEIERITSIIKSPFDICCKNKSCPNSKKALSEHEFQYRLFGSSSSGAKRYQCRSCKSTFSINFNPTKRQRTPEINAFLLKALINKVPMRRICELVDIRPATLYNRIEFFKKRCLIFSSIQEKSLSDALCLKTVRVSLDRQEYVFNWSSQFDRRNTKLSAISSVENKSGFVFDMHLDFDSSIDAYEAELHSREIDDQQIDPPYRKYARIFLPDEPSPIQNESFKLPATGVRVKSEYTMFAHLIKLAEKLKKAKNIDLYLDQDPNLDAAAIHAFKDKVIDMSVNIFIVRINKNLTVDQRRLALAQRRLNLQSEKDNPQEWKAAKKAVDKQLNYFSKNNIPHKESWVKHPLPNMGEPEKQVLLLTPRENVKSSTLNESYLFASLNGVERYFMLLRRRISLFERPLHTASGLGRTWHGTSPYNPEVAESLLQIFRVVYNYSLTGKDNKTPAMRLGVASKAYSLEELLS